MGVDREAEPAAFVAYAIGVDVLPELEPASRWRRWIEEAPHRWPARCLPLLMANESGWVLRLPYEVRARWSGGLGESALDIDQEGALGCSPFGMGILTFGVPYVFRTPPGWDLLVRGPANSPKDGVSPLEGMVESDWVAAPFTMNWQVTRPDCEIVFAAGEPYCQVVPVRRWDMEALAPRVEAVDTVSTLDDEVRHHQAERHAATLMKRGAALLGHTDMFWDGKYFRGTTPRGEPAPGHRTKRRLRPFTPPR